MLAMISEGSANNSYLKSVVTEWIHVWKFKYYYDGSQCDDGMSGSEIGIWKTKFGAPSLDAYIDNTHDEDRTGYSITTNGCKSGTDDGNFFGWGSKGGLWRYH